MKLLFKRNILVMLSFFLLMIWAIYYIVNWHISIYENDPLILFYNIIGDGLFLIGVLAPIFVIIPSIYNFHKELHSGYIKNVLTRTSYKKYMLSSYFKCILKSMILPIFLVLLLFMCCLKLESFSFGSGALMYNYYFSPDAKFVPILGQFMVSFLLGVLLNSIFYVNIGLFYTKKNSSFLVNVILSYVTFIGIEIIVECLIGGIVCAKLLGIHNLQNTLNLFNIWCYDNVISLPICLIYYTCLTIFSSLIVYLIYRNKESVLIEVEKNF